MTNPEPFWQSIPLAPILIGMIGSIAKYLNEVMTMRSEFRWFNVPMTAFIGGFLGYMAFLISDSYGWSEHWTSVVAGVAGASGSHGFEFIIQRVQAVMNSPKEES